MSDKEISIAGVIKEAGSSAKKKTGSWRTFKPKVNDKCTGCGICSWFCPDDAIRIVETKDKLRSKDLSQASSGKKTAEIDYDHCKGCMICVAECTQKALTSGRER